jgi:hypothetical protein
MIASLVTVLSYLALVTAGPIYPICNLNYNGYFLSGPCTLDNTEMACMTAGGQLAEAHREYVDRQEFLRIRRGMRSCDNTMVARARDLEATVKTLPAPIRLLTLGGFEDDVDPNAQHWALCWSNNPPIDG